MVEPYSSSVTDALRLFDALATIARVGGHALVPHAVLYNDFDIIFSGHPSSLPANAAPLGHYSSV